MHPIKAAVAVAVAAGILLRKHRFASKPCSSNRVNPAAAATLNAHPTHQASALPLQDEYCAKEPCYGTQAALAAIALAGSSILLALASGTTSVQWALFLASLHVVLATFLWMRLAAVQRRQHSKKPKGQPSVTTSTPHSPNMLLNGIWIKAPESESMTEACNLLNLGGLVRMAISLVKGVEFQLTNEDGAGYLHMAVFSVISWFKVKESYPLSGAPVTCNRRDLRKGKHTGSCEVMDGGTIKLEMEWGEPYPGKGCDVLRLVSSDELHVVTTLYVTGREHTYTTIYRRKH